MTPNSETTSSQSTNKTIDKLMHTDNILAGTEAKLTEIGYERLGENIQEAIQAITQAMLEALPEEKMLDGTNGIYSREYHNVVNGYNKAISEMETAIKKIGGE